MDQELTRTRRSSRISRNTSLPNINDNRDRSRSPRDNVAVNGESSRNLLTEAEIADHALKATEYSKKATEHTNTVVANFTSVSNELKNLRKEFENYKAKSEKELEDYKAKSEKELENRDAKFEAYKKKMDDELKELRELVSKLSRKCDGCGNDHSSIDDDTKLFSPKCIGSKCVKGLLENLQEEFGFELPPPA